MNALGDRAQLRCKQFSKFSLQVVDVFPKELLFPNPSKGFKGLESSKETKQEAHTLFFHHTHVMSLDRSDIIDVLKRAREKCENSRETE